MNKQDRRIENLRILDQEKVCYYLCNNGYHVQIRKQGCNVDYYPSTNKWVINGKVFKGNALEFISWLKERFLIRPEALSEYKPRFGLFENNLEF